MPADVRINQLTTDVNVTDATAMLTPQILAQITEAVIQRLADKQRVHQAREQDQRLGAACPPIGREYRRSRP